MKVKIVTYLFVIILVLSIFLAVYSSWLFAMGFHNLDLGQNIEKLNFAYGTNFTDVVNSGATATGLELYHLGSEQMHKAFFLFGMAVFLIGFSLSKLVKID